MAMATPISYNTIRVKIRSFNMHGFHQGCPVLDDMIELFNPDVLLLQEHWLTPANLNKFDSHFTNYFSFGCSAMSTVVETGMLRGRPFVKNSLRSITHTIHCDDRLAIIKIGNCIIINGGAKNAGVENAGATKHGKPSEKNTLKYQTKYGRRGFHAYLLAKSKSQASCLHFLVIYSI